MSNRGFTLVEMMVAVLLLVIISVPIMTVFYFGITTMEKQIGMTQALSISRETMQVIVDDLEKYSSNATKVSPEYSEELREYMEGNRICYERYGEKYYEEEGVRYCETKLVIRDDNAITTGPKKVVYTYRREVVDNVSHNRVLIREVDNVSQVLLTDSQLSDKYYTDTQKEVYDIEHNEPVKFTKDDAKNRILIYLRIKSDNKADAQESEYAYTVEEGEKTRQVLRFEADGYIKTADSEKFNLYQSSFTIESYVKLDNIDKNRCLVNLVGSDGKSKVSVSVGEKKLKLRIGEDTMHADTNKFKEASISLMNGTQDCTTNMWRKFVIVYDNTKNQASMYLTKSGEGGKLDTTPKDETYFSTEGAFYGKMTIDGVEVKKPIIVDEIYLGNARSYDYNDDYHDVNGNDYYIYMYDTRLWNKAIDVSKYDATKRLIGNEDGLLLYMKDNYKKSSDGDKVSLDIRNAVNNKRMVIKDVLASEELETVDKTTNANIRNVLGY